MEIFMRGINYSATNRRVIRGLAVILHQWIKNFLLYCGCIIRKMNNYGSCRDNSMCTCTYHSRMPKRSQKGGVHPDTKLYGAIYKKGRSLF
jgi:hypothetical protein